MDGHCSARCDAGRTLCTGGTDCEDYHWDFETDVQGWKLESADLGPPVVDMGHAHSGTASLEIPRVSKNIALRKEICKAGGSQNIGSGNLSIWIDLEHVTSQEGQAGTCKLGFLVGGRELQGGEFGLSTDRWEQLFGPSIDDHTVTVDGFRLSCTLTTEAQTATVNVHLDDGSFGF